MKKICLHIGLYAGLPILFFYMTTLLVIFALGYTEKYELIQLMYPFLCWFTFVVILSIFFIIAVMLTISSHLNKLTELDKAIEEAEREKEKAKQEQYEAFKLIEKFNNLIIEHYPEY